MPPKSVTISISTEAYDELQNAMKAAGLETQPDQLIIKRDVSITQPIDFRLATIRRDCLVEAVKANPSQPLQLARDMFNFVTGKEVEPKPGGWK